jgi:hypothetical protein
MTLQSAKNDATFVYGMVVMPNAYLANRGNLRRFIPPEADAHPDECDDIVRFKFNDKRRRPIYGGVHTRLHAGSIHEGLMPSR